MITTQEERKILIVFDDMIAIMTNIITQSYFNVQKDVRLNSPNHLIMKIHSRKKLQNIVFDHSADIDYKDFVKIYKKCTNEPYSFFTIDTTLPAGNPMRFRKNFSGSPLYK